VAIIVPGGERASENTVAQPPAPASPSASETSVGADGSGAEALYSRALGVRDFGPLQDEQHLDACLQANGLDPAVRPDGIRPVTVGGRPGVMVIYTTGKFAQYRLVAFPASCDANHPGKLFDKVVGAR
jgi:hypothetical protein